MLGKRINEWEKTAHAKEIQEGDIVILMGKEGNRPSFYRGHAIVDTVFEFENYIGEKLIALLFSDYTD